MSQQTDRLIAASRDARAAEGDLALIMAASTAAGALKDTGTFDQTSLGGAWRKLRDELRAELERLYADVGRAYLEPVAFPAPERPKGPPAGSQGMFQMHPSNGDLPREPLAREISEYPPVARATMPHPARLPPNGPYATDDSCLDCGYQLARNRQGQPCPGAEWARRALATTGERAPVTCQRCSRLVPWALTSRPCQFHEAYAYVKDDAEMATGMADPRPTSKSPPASWPHHARPVDQGPSSPGVAYCAECGFTVDLALSGQPCPGAEWAHQALGSDPTSKAAMSHLNPIVCQRCSRVVPFSLKARDCAFHENYSVQAPTPTEPAGAPL